VGPYAEEDEIRAPILEAGAKAGVDLQPAGARAYSTNTLESG
jgi:vanillate/3-O-methylgallate O-demethylase